MSEKVPPKLMGFAPRRLGHANLFVTSLERSVPFYRDLCGFCEVFREPGIKAVFFSNGSSHHDVALMEISEQPRVGRDGHVQVSTDRGQKAGLNHLGFEMESEKALVEGYRRVVAAGQPVFRTTDHGMSHSVYMFDPEGNLLEFYADAVDDWRQFYRSHENQLISGDWDPEASPPSATPLYDDNFTSTAVPGAAVRARRIACASFVVSDLPRMREYYESVAGLRVMEDASNPSQLVLAGSLGEPVLVLIGARAGLEPGLHRMSFEVWKGDDPLLAIRAFEARKVNIVSRLQGPRRTAVVVGDPDGMQLEFHAPDRDGGAVQELCAI